MDTDFLKLYRELGVMPGCTLPAFKQAYRRRVGEFHPDRTYDGRGNASERLKELNLHYAAAMAFHRRLGRLPGTIPEPRSPRRPASPRRERPVAYTLRPMHPISHEPPNRWLLLVFSLVAIIPLWTLLPSEDVGSAEAPGTEPGASGGSTTSASGMLEPGMDATSVSALLGVPVINVGNEDQWNYGPSWIRFECGEVVDWHNSVLRPLPVVESLGHAPARDRRPAQRAWPCPPKSTRASIAHPTDGHLARASRLA